MRTYCKIIRRYSSRRLMIEDNLIFIDNHIIVVNKWSGLLSQGDISNTPSLFSLVKDYIKVKYNKPGNVYIGLVHRLDKPVSGVMIFARTSKAAARLSESFKNRLTEKKYFAVVHGTMTTSERRLSQMISTSTNHMNRIQIFEMSKEQNDANQYPSNTAPAILDYEVLATHRNPMASQQNRHTENHITLDQSLVKITLETGRKHQIRAQLSHIGHPIVGDVKYGASPSFSSKDIALHSFLLSISHPISMQKMTFVARPPEIWKRRFGQHAVDVCNNLIDEYESNSWTKGEIFVHTN